MEASAKPQLLQQFTNLSRLLGPLMNEKSGRWYLIGIVSAGYSCASRGQPGIYHRVAHTVDWISHIVNAVA